MAVVVFVLVVLAIVWFVWQRRTRRGRPTAPGPLGDLVDQGRDLIAPLYPSRPLSRRALPRRLLRAAEQTITIGVSGTVLVPTRIEIAVNPEDLEPFTDAMEWLRRDVGEALRQKAAANGWVVPSGPEVVITPDDERPVRLPRAVGRIEAFRPEDVRTKRRPGPSPDAVDRPGARPEPTPPAAAPPPSPSPTPTGSTSVVVGPDGPESAGDGLEQPTVPADPIVHLRLVSLAEPQSNGGDDLNALLVATAEPLVLGRSREADLQVKDRQVSARHCVLSFEPDQSAVVVRDLRSTNGTYVDGQRVHEAALAPGAVLRLGGSEWRVEIESVGPSQGSLVI